jgi:hypothetical protein
VRLDHLTVSRRPKCQNKERASNSTVNVTVGPLDIRGDSIPFIPTLGTKNIDFSNRSSAVSTLAKLPPVNPGEGNIVVLKLISDFPSKRRYRICAELTNCSRASRSGAVCRYARGFQLLAKETCVLVNDTISSMAAMVAAEIT